MYMPIIMTCLIVVFMFLVFILGGNKRSQYIQWGLGVDSISFYSSPFTVSQKSITLVGYQNVLGGESPIVYSVVKQNWWGKTKVYGQVVVYGDYNSPESFNVAINNIPYGEHYRIEIINYCNISWGKFKIISK